MISYCRFLSILLALLVAACSSSSDNPQPSTPNTPTTPTTPVTPFADFMRGADLSFLPTTEGEGTLYYADNGAPADVILLLKSRGCNTIRMRIWHTPVDAHSSLSEVKALADRVKAAGLKVYLSIHYSDTWADPGHQSKPAPWQGLAYSVLKDSVYRYTKKVMNLIQPNYVQIGNELNGGILWEDGRISNFSNFIDLVKEGCKAVREVSSTTKILIHFAGTDNAPWFFTQLKNSSVDYDMIGLSYYPVWHGLSLDVLKTTINTLIADTGKPLVIAETAYPFTLGWADYTNNIVGLSSQLIPGYPATPEGQKSYLLAIKTMLKQNSKGAGFCYWGAEWVAFRGPTATNGSAAENQALFSFTNIELPACTAFAE